MVVSAKFKRSRSVWSAAQRAGTPSEVAGGVLVISTARSAVAACFVSVACDGHIDRLDLPFLPSLVASDGFRLAAGIKSRPRRSGRSNGDSGRFEKVFLLWQNG